MVKLQKHPIDVKTVAAWSLEMARPAIAARKIQLTVALPSEPIWLEADGARMIQVLTNLLTNAAKFTDESGQIQLTVSAQDHEAVLRISDTGVGISSDSLPRVFDPFIQEASSLDHSRDGFGIGLTLVRSVVELHGGTVQGSSTGRGRDCEFVLRLPLLKEASAPTNSQPERIQDSRQGMAPANLDRR